VLDETVNSLNKSNQNLRTKLNLNFGSGISFTPTVMVTPP